MTTGRTDDFAVLHHRFSDDERPWVHLADRLDRRGAATLLVIDGVATGPASGVDTDAEARARSRVVLELAGSSLLSLVVLRSEARTSSDALTLALACDLRWGTPDAALRGGALSAGSLPYADVAGPAIQRLGSSRALSLALRTDPVPAAEALSWGLLDEVVPVEALAGRIESLSALVAALPRDLLAETKALLTSSEHNSLERRARDALGRLTQARTEP